MAEKRHEGGISYHTPAKTISISVSSGVTPASFRCGHSASPPSSRATSQDANLGFAVGGWGGVFVGTIIITIMYLGLTYSIAEMSPALPHTGGAYSFARTAFGPSGRLHHRSRREHRICADAGGDRVLHRHLPHGDFRHARRVPAALVDLWVHRLCRAQSPPRRAVVHGHDHDDPARHRHSRRVLHQCASVFRFRQIRDEYRRRPGDRSGNQRCLGAMDRSSPSGYTASLPPCHSRSGCFSPSSSSRSRRKSRRPETRHAEGVVLGMFTLIALGFLVLLFNPSIPIEKAK